MEESIEANTIHAGIKNAFNKLKAATPEHHDTITEAFGLTVSQIVLTKPNTFFVTGRDDFGNEACVVTTTSHLVVRITHRKRDGDRTIKGFGADLTIT